MVAQSRPGVGLDHDQTTFDMYHNTKYLGCQDYNIIPSQNYIFSDISCMIGAPQGEAAITAFVSGRGFVAL
jgi:hypothetical protein